MSDKDKNVVFVVDNAGGFARLMAKGSTEQKNASGLAGLKPQGGSSQTTPTSQAAPKEKK